MFTRSPLAVSAASLSVARTVTLFVCPSTISIDVKLFPPSVATFVPTIFLSTTFTVSTSSGTASGKMGISISFSVSPSAKLKVPLVVRLQGTNVDAGREILAKSGIPIIVADELWDAAQKAVTAAKQVVK